jgi:hypothetical protein
MKRLCITAALVLLSGSLALAQTSPNVGGMSNPSMPSNSVAPPWVNPSNSQDISAKSNPQDLTRPGAVNREDLLR